MTEKLIVLDFGGQYAQLIARRVRELGVYCEILPHTCPYEEIVSDGVHGVIFTGGPASVYAEDAPSCDQMLFSGKVPVLGICYGAQLMAYDCGGKVEPNTISEYGKIIASFDAHPLFSGVDNGQVWMSHRDSITALPEGFSPIAHSEHCPVAAFSCDAKQLYGIQFHPEVVHTICGQQMLRNFIYSICGCKGGYRAADLADSLISEIRQTVGDKKVISGLSGGADSSVASVLVHKAVGSQLTCIFVDHGLLRQDEAKEVLQNYRDNLGLNIVFVDASERFLSKLDGVSDPETKRKIIGEEFIRVFEEEAQKLGGSDFLVQGTIYPDIVESGKGKSAVIKSHHNVGGLPDDTKFRTLIEPLKTLFKDEVRELGEHLGIVKELVWRQPFPGPGLAVRILGDITPDKIRIVQQSDAILRQEIASAGMQYDIWQYFTVYTPLKTVGVMGDERTYDNVVVVRAVTSFDAMTVDFADIPHDVLSLISNRIINEVRGVNRVVYDITSKPPGTIEWE